MRRRRRVGWRAWPALAVLALLFAALVTARGGDPALYPPKAEGETVFLVDNGFHTALALPRAALDGHAAGRAAAIVTDKPWIVVGWGDERFFIEEGLSARRVLDGLRALFAPDNPAVIRFDGLRASPDQIWSSGVRPLRLSPEGRRRLVARIDASLALRGGAAVRVPSRPEPDAGYFRSRETFSLVHLCNHWTAQLLDAAGVPTTPVLDTLPAGMALDLSLRARPPSAARR